MGGVVCTNKIHRCYSGNGHTAPATSKAPASKPREDDTEEEGSVTPVNSSGRSSISSTDSSTPQGFDIPHDDLYDDVFSDPAAATGSVSSSSSSRQQQHEPSERPRQLSEQQAKLVAPIPPDDPQPSTSAAPDSDPEPDYDDAQSSEDVVDSAPNQNGDGSANEHNTDSAIYDELEDLAPRREGGSKKPGRSSVKHESGMSENEQVILDFNEHLVSTMFNSVKN